MYRLRVLSLLGVLALTACAEPPVSPVPTMVGAGRIASIVEGEQTYFVLGTGESLPADFADQVAASGGSVVDMVAEIGVAVVRSSAPEFRQKLAKASGIVSVTPDVVLEWTAPASARGEGVDEDAAGASASIGDNEPRFALQWALRAIQAPEAWNAGYTGRGVRVAIIDGGLLRTHPDLMPNVDHAAGRCFVVTLANCIALNNYTVDGSSHATHVAGIVAAADNSVGTIGVAPNATLIGVKVLHNGVGSFEAIFNGIMYAAKPVSEGGAGAHVINMSLGATLKNTKDKAIKADVRELKKAIDLATKLAFMRGVTVIASAGNDSLNFDADKGLLALPAENQHVISISATAPVGWALPSRLATNFEKPAWYTNFGKSLVDLSAPGGSDALFRLERVDAICTVAGVRNFCEVFDMIHSTTRTGWSWMQGTSMAAPVASGVAALIIEANGGTLSPNGVRARLQQGAIDHGKPGNDQFYGHGWVNAFRSVQ
jgi:subtilisin family serine protease